ncbi:hypothetical protein DWB84_07290 [Saccharophagus sp. K07]|nr:hypothetical protein [Saccharophagus sp. K07]
MLMAGFGYILMILGGLAVGGLFFYGIYFTLFNDVRQGLMLIGASVVCTFFVRMLSGLLILIGTTISTKAIEKQIGQ